MAPKDTMDALIKEIGGNDDFATVTQWLDTGFPPLNHALGARWDAGFPVGRMVEIAGPPSAGKTAIATRAMIAAQAAGGIAGFADHERSFSSVLGEKLGLDLTPGRFIYRKPKTFEESVATFQFVCKTIREKKVIDKKAPICWVFDSLASMVPQSILTDSKGKERDAESRNMNDNTALARATSAHFPAIAMLTEEYNVCTIFLNQMRTKIGVMFGDPRKTAGGDAPEFYFSQRLWLSSSQIKKDKEVLGAEVTGKLMKNKVNRPFRTATWFFMFDEDGFGHFDRELSMVEFLAAEGILKPGTKPGNYLLGEKQYPKATIAKVIKDTNSFQKLVDMLPAAYEPPVAAQVDTSEVTEEEGEEA